MTSSFILQPKWARCFRRGFSGSCSGWTSFPSDESLTAQDSGPKKKYISIPTDDQPLRRTVNIYANLSETDLDEFAFGSSMNYQCQGIPGACGNLVRNGGICFCYSIQIWKRKFEEKGAHSFPRPASAASPISHFPRCPSDVKFTVGLAAFWFLWS